MHVWQKRLGDKRQKIRARASACFFVFCWLFSTSQAQQLDPTPDVAAPVSAPNNPNPPVANNQPDDQAIKISVQSRLPVDADTVEVAVRDGVVFLTGFVKTDSIFEIVVARAFSAPSVINVDANQLNIQYPQKVRRDLLMTAQIKGVLIAMNVLGKDMSTWPIYIETKAGQVYVSGTVASEAIRDNILYVMRCVRGVGPIHSQLKVHS